MERPEDGAVGTSGRGQASSAKRKRQVSIEEEEPGQDWEGSSDAELYNGSADEAAARKERMQKKLKKYKDAYDRRGIIYISRIPPHMKPQKLRHMLSLHGEVTRIYLAPEDPSVRKRRKRMGGNSGKNFAEGWVEFEDKRVAKRVATQLNGNPMGGKRRSAYHYDLWCLKYLSRFKWDHLTEEIAYQKAVREQRLAAEIAAAKRERDFYLSRVDKAKAVAAQQERKRKRQEKDGDATHQSGGGAAAAPSSTGDAPASKGGGEAVQAKEPKLLRTYAQKKAKADPVSEQAPMLDPGVLALVAGKNRSRTARQG